MSDDQDSDNSTLLHCSFCGKSQKEVRLISGPNVFICYDCVDVCNDIIHETQEEGIALIESIYDELDQPMDQNTIDEYFGYNEGSTET